MWKQSEKYNLFALVWVCLSYVSPLTWFSIFAVVVAFIYVVSQIFCVFQENKENK